MPARGHRERAHVRVRSSFLKNDILLVLAIELIECRRLADGDVRNVLPPIKYFLGYRSRTLTRSLTLNPNPISDPNPNPKINKKQNDTRMKLNIELYLKVDFLGTGWVYKRPITGMGRETHMDIPVF